MTLETARCSFTTMQLPVARWSYHGFSINQKDGKVNIDVPAFSKYIKLYDEKFYSKYSESTYGHVVYLKPDYDLSPFPLVHMDTDEFKETFKHSSSVEHSFKRIFEDYCIKKLLFTDDALEILLATSNKIKILKSLEIKPFEDFHLEAPSRFELENKGFADL